MVCPPREVVENTTGLKRDEHTAPNSNRQEVTIPAPTGWSTAADRYSIQRVRTQDQARAHLLLSRSSRFPHEAHLGEGNQERPLRIVTRTHLGSRIEVFP